MTDMAAERSVTKFDKEVNSAIDEFDAVIAAAKNEAGRDARIVAGEILFQIAKQHGLVESNLHEESMLGSIGKKLTSMFGGSKNLAKSAESFKKKFSQLAELAKEGWGKDYADPLGQVLYQIATKHGLAK